VLHGGPLEAVTASKDLVPSDLVLARYERVVYCWILVGGQMFLRAQPPLDAVPEDICEGWICFLCRVSDDGGNGADHV
jgi:hypothetical protein